MTIDRAIEIPNPEHLIAKYDSRAQEVKDGR